MAELPGIHLVGGYPERRAAEPAANKCACLRTQQRTSEALRSVNHELPACAASAAAGWQNGAVEAAETELESSICTAPVCLQAGRLAAGCQTGKAG